MAMPTKPSEVWVALEAKTPLELTQLQFENNIKKQMRFEYTPPIFVRGSWFVFYIVDILLDPDFDEFRV